MNPDLNFTIEGLVGLDNQSDFGVTIAEPVADGSAESPTPEGIYDINASGASSSRYLFSYLSGKLIVSNKFQQQIIFDQNLSDILATTEDLTLSGYSTNMEGNLTNLPITYEVEDRSIARILVTKDDNLVAYWKLDESLYEGFRDELESYSGTLVGLSSTGTDKVWTSGLFGNGLALGQTGGKADMGSVRLDPSFSISFWLNPNEILSLIHI